MEQKDFDRLNAYLARWQGAKAFLNKYVDDDDRLVIGLVRPSNAQEFVGICFINCTFLSGPTRWNNAHLNCRSCDLGGGDIGVEMSDAEGGFLLRCGGPIVIGDSELVFPES